MTTSRKARTPGDAIRDLFLDRQGLTQAALAKTVGLARPTLNGCIMGKRRLTVKLAIRLSEISEMSAEEWMKLQTDVDLRAAREKLPSKMPLCKK